MGALLHGATTGLLRHTLLAMPRRIRDTLRSRSDAILAELLTQPQAASRLRPALQGAPARLLGRPVLPSLTYTNPGQEKRGGRVTNPYAGKRRSGRVATSFYATLMEMHAPKP
jgi:hypothetical protein